MGLVHMVAGRFMGRGVEKEDLVQIGTLGLIKAVDRFDVSSGNAFSTYAVPLIMGEIRRFLRDDGMIHVSRQIKEHARKIAIVREQEKMSDNRELTLDELSKKTGIACEDIILAIRAGQEVDSLQRMLYGEQGEKELSLEARVSNGNSFENQLVEHLSLEQAIHRLDEEERKLIFLRYMESKSQSEVAKLLNTNQVAVSRMEKRILNSMRQSMKGV